MTTIGGMQDVLVGTAGHIDHGKTTLVKALTGIDADRLQEEKRRGITIDIGFASKLLGDFRIGFIDVPGHEKFVKNMLAGVGSIQFVLLVVAADESVMPQTVEHFRICQLLGISSGLVVLTKTSQADPDLVDVVKEEVFELVQGTFLDGAPLIAVDSLSGDGISELEGALLVSLKDLPSLDSDRRLFRMPIDRVFSSRGFGTVVTGTPLAGRVGKNDTLRAYPTNRRSKVRSAQVFGETVDLAHAGQRTAINLSGVERGELERGLILAPPDIFEPTHMLDVSLQVLEDAPAPIRQRDPIRFHHGSAEIMGRIYLFGAKEMAPGSRGLAQLRLDTPTLVCSLDHFVLRRYSPMTTIAGGVVLDSRAVKHKKKSLPQVVQQLENLQQGWRERAADLPIRFIDHWITRAGAVGLTLRDLASRLGLRVGVVSQLVEGSGKYEVVSRELVISTNQLVELEECVLKFLQGFHRDHPLQLGISQEELKNRSMPHAPSTVTQHVLHRLLSAHRIEVFDGLVKEVNRQVELSSQQAEVRLAILARFQTETLAPPSLTALIETVGHPEDATREIYYYLIQCGELLRVSGDIVISGRQKEWMVTNIYSSFQSGDSFEVQQFKELFGITRKFAIPFLEFLDRERITRRVVDQRVVL